MKIVLLQEHLLSAIQSAGKFSSTDSQFAALGGISLNAKEGSLTVRSTNLKVGYETVVGAKIEEEGTCIVLSKTFIEFISTLTKGKVECFFDQGSFFVTQMGVKGKFSTFSVSDFPQFPLKTERTFSLPSDLLLQLTDSTTYAAGIDESRPVLASVLFEGSSDSTTMVCTDGYRLALKTIQNSDNEENTFSFIVNAKVFTETIHTLVKEKSKTIEFGVSQELKQVYLYAGETTVFMRLTEGEFPPYKKIIPSSFLIRTKIDTSQFIQSLRNSLVFAKENSSIVTLAYESGKITVTSSSATLGENETHLDSSYTGEEKGVISFNARFVLDTLLHISSPQIEMCLNDASKPVVIFPDKDDSYCCVIMPFKR